MTKVIDTSGPYGAGTYVHQCADTTWCAHAGGAGNGCGGVTEYTAPNGDVTVLR